MRGRGLCARHAGAGCVAWAAHSAGPRERDRPSRLKPVFPRIHLLTSRGSEQGRAAGSARSWARRTSPGLRRVPLRPGSPLPPAARTAHRAPRDAAPGACPHTPASTRALGTEPSRRLTTWHLVLRGTAAQGLRFLVLDTKR